MKTHSLKKPATLTPCSRKLASTLVVVIAGLAGLLMPTTSHAIEEPEYTVVNHLDGIEIRDYPSFTVAQTTVSATESEAGNRAFPILAGYIFGKNKGERKLAMTAPVTQAAIPVKLEMTAPVTQVVTPGGFLVQFVLPRGVTAVTAPEPLDARVLLRDEPARRVAVIQYSGFWSESNYSDHLTHLQSALKTAGIAWHGEPVFSRYNAPFTPWFMRRNEIWLHVDKPV